MHELSDSTTADSGTEAMPDIALCEILRYEDAGLCTGKVGVRFSADARNSLMQV